MPIERAPYIRYNEETSIVQYGSVDADIPVFIAPTKVLEPTKNLTVGDGEVGLKLSGTEYVTTSVASEITAVGVQNEDESITILRIKDSDGYVVEQGTGNYVKVETNPIVDLEHFYAYNNIANVKSDIVDSHLLEILEDFLTENSYYMRENMGSAYFYVIALPPTPTGADLSKALDLIRLRKEITTLVFSGVDIVGTQAEVKGFLNDEAEDTHLRIAYYEAPVNNQTAGIVNGVQKSKLEKYAGEILQLNNTISSPRVCLVDRNQFGKIIAKICNTQYYLEPGYLPFYSVNVGEFDMRTTKERDALCMAGLIFGEDDYTLENIVPRICLGVSSAFGKSPNGYASRTTDSLLHARRNVDHHVRELIKIIAPQLKRNETSVSLRGVQETAFAYLSSEYNKGTIMEYEFTVRESEINPYCLNIYGKITPVNSTLAIEFYNTIGAPHAIASDYV